MRMPHPAPRVATAVAMLWLCAPAPRCQETASPVVRAVMFSSPTCPHCAAVRQQVLPAMVARYGPQLQIVVLSTATPSGRDLFSAACDHYWIGRRAVPLLVVGNVPLMGSDEIPRRLPELIARHLEKGGVDWPDIPGLRDFLAESAGQVPPGEPEAAPRLDEPPQAAALEPTPTTLANGEVEEPGIVAAPATAPAVAAAPSSVIDLTGEDASQGVLARMRRDPHGNGLAVLVLAGMVLTLLVSAVTLRRALPLAPAPRPPRLDWLTPLLALAGLGVAAYLAHVEVRQVEAVCGPVGDCNTVQQSEYARLFGVLPIGVLGLLGFLAILTAWALRRWGAPPVANWAAAALLAMAGFGTLFSVYLTFLEPFVIGATCLWCLSSAVIMTVLYALALGPGRAAGVRLRRSARP